MKTFSLAIAGTALLLAACAADRNEGVFIVNGVEYPKLTADRLAEIRQVWTSSSQPMSEKTKAGREIAYWILDAIANAESQGEAPCRRLDLVEIQGREVGLMVPLRTGASETTFLRATTFHEAWLVNACGKLREWRVLDDSANPQNPLRVFRTGAA